ncbi:hypothetical protein NGTWS0302_06400 [Mycolicibacterium cyprinidarum]|uniref:MFS transporter n=1 Tax=Mycolicibacterium cyprinidarum TaxID=2860311 RepID=A0ABQ4V5P9_9MYCO|nr:hypothetical protein NGTWS1702_36660 [Mycolicibacterium sp. NGTWSNA01]GJF14015.1 hypothetical protein NGTWS1803_26310 [Mycolicibacterium sp. NGTWS1803]GJF14318.1 hypothetical protein NGTWS0302_06400 [Mycolicibacterium sp. NGTWS0302]
MGTPKSRARWLRGALVGVTSAVVTVGAHGAAGGGIPSGGALIISLLLCAIVGTLVGCLRLEGRGARWLGTATALGAAQLLGHVALMASGHHHGSPDLAPSPAMIGTHIGAAVILGVTITAAEYLYVVCSSVLRWLRLFAMHAPRPTPRIVRRTTNVVVVPPVFATGLGMRAPPWTVSTA